MAIEFYAAETIPKVPFSHDFCSSKLSSPFMPLNSSIDFEFDAGIKNTDQECYYSSADELFSNGKILPLQIRKKISPPKQQLHPSTRKPETRNQIKNIARKEANDQNQSCRSFWELKRSISLNFVSGYKKRLFPPSTPLSRSSSTGSAPKVKPGIGNHRQNHQKGRSSLKKNFGYGSHHGNGVTINPILNVPLVDVSCLSSIFLTGKDKKK